MTAKARSVVRRLVDLGAVVPGPQTERLVSEVDRMIHEDYIPGGEVATFVTNLRSAPAGNRCGVRTGEDVQSGPFFCGEVATLMGDSAHEVVCVCSKHEPVLRRLERKTDGNPQQTG